MKPVDAAVLDWEIEPEDGFNLSTGEHWRGYRVRYKRGKTRRWSKFLVVADEHFEYDEFVQSMVAVIEQHETMS